MAFAIVLIKDRGRWLLAGGSFSRPIRGVDEKNVLVSVVVVIEKRRAAAHRFGKQFVAVGAVVVFESDSGFGGDVFECNGRNLDLLEGLHNGGSKLSDLWRGRRRLAFNDGVNNSANDCETYEYDDG